MGRLRVSRFLLLIICTWLLSIPSTSILSLNNVEIYYLSKREGYYGLYVKRGRETLKLFDTRDILEANPNLARYQISYDVSRDGRYVAYSALDLSGEADIFLIDMRTGGVRNLTRDTRTDTSPVFSHDGEWIAFLSHERGVRRFDEIMLIHRDGTQRVRLTSPMHRISSLTFSPDDRNIMFVKRRGDRSTITLLDIESAKLHDLTAPVCLSLSPQFSPSGDRIVYTSNCQDSLDIWIMNADGSGKALLYKGSGDDYDPHFTGDGESVVFISNYEDKILDEPTRFAVFSIEPEGGSARNLIPTRYTERQFFMSSIDVSLEQNLIYFQGKYADRGRKSHYSIYSFDVEKSALKRVVFDEFDNMKPKARFNNTHLLQ